MRVPLSGACEEEKEAGLCLECGRSLPGGSACRHGDGPRGLSCLEPFGPVGPIVKRGPCGALPPFPGMRPVHGRSELPLSWGDGEERPSGRRAGGFVELRGEGRKGFPLAACGSGAPYRSPRRRCLWWEAGSLWLCVFLSSQKR